MSKTARIEIRAEPGQEDQIRRAAGLVNQSISAFVVTAAVERADEVMATWSTTTVPTEFFDQLMAALDEPAPANEALRKVARQRKAGRVA
ncbi:MAG: type II toxin-antitoxin system TacA family antitoxin [Acidimicrobiales bacterium]